MQAETKPKFDQGKRFQIKPLKVETKTKRPTFTKNNATHYNYMVKAEVKGNPEPIWFEYASPTQDALDKFVLHIWQWVVCMQPSDIACNIQPCEPPGEEKTREQLARELVEASANPSAARMFPPKLSVTYPGTYSQDAPRPVDLRGHPYAFIYAWAKDLVCMEGSNAMAPVDPNAPVEPISRISYYAERLYDDMMKKINT